MERLWKYLENQFLIATLRSFLKAVRLAEYTDNALHSRVADPFFLAQYNYFHPLYDALNTEYDTWKNQQGFQQGKTVTVYELLDDLSSKHINSWDSQVQAAGIAKGSANYVALFPKGHKPFQTGEITSRINAVNALSLGIGLQLPPAPPPTHPLVILKGQVDAFYLAVVTARNTQEEEISDTGTESDALEQARVNGMVGLYAVLGACMNKFADNPVVIEPLFNLELLRQHRQMLFRGHAVINKPHTVVERTVQPTVQIKIKNIGVTDLQVYWAATAGAHPVPPTHPVAVPAGTEVTLDASAFGDVATHHYLMILNMDLVNKGEWEVEFL